MLCISPEGSLLWGYRRSKLDLKGNFRVFDVYVFCVVVNCWSTWFQFEWLFPNLEKLFWINFDALLLPIFCEVFQGLPDFSGRPPNRKNRFFHLIGLLRGLGVLFISVACFGGVFSGEGARLAVDCIVTMIGRQQNCLRLLDWDQLKRLCSLPFLSERPNSERPKYAKFNLDHQIFW